MCEKGKEGIEQLVSDEVIKNLEKAYMKLEKLDKKLEEMAEKYSIPYNKVWETFQDEKN